MAISYLGGFRVLGAGWVGRRSLYVDFVSNYTTRLLQLYAGRTLIGVTTDVAATRVFGQLQPSLSPPPLTLLSVAVADRLVDFGPQLPRVPWNRYELRWNTEDYPADAHHFVLTGSPAAGEPIDAGNVIAKVPFIGDGAYVYQLPPLPSSGEFAFAVTPYDDALPDGNPGTPAEVSIAALVMPPDVQLDGDGNRFEIAVEAGTATATFAY